MSDGLRAWLRKLRELVNELDGLVVELTKLVGSTGKLVRALVVLASVALAARHVLF